jgi:hypothetical protein
MEYCTASKVSFTSDLSFGCTLTSPSYLGDALIHASFPLLLYSTGCFHPLALLGTQANYIFLRAISGDKESEASQEERYKAEDPVKLDQLETRRTEKNGFWPRLQEIANPCTWVVVGAGGIGIVAEKLLFGETA